MSAYRNRNPRLARFYDGSQRGPASAGLAPADKSPAAIHDPAGRHRDPLEYFVTEPDAPEFTAESLVTTVTGLITRLPVGDAVKATRTAAEVTAALVRQGQSVLELHVENARLREALAASSAREAEQQRRVDAAEAEAARLRQVVRLLTGPGPESTSPKD